MKVDEWTSEDGHTPGGGEFPPCAGLTSNALPEAQSTVSAESSQTGVSTRNAHIASKPKAQKEEEFPHWYALRTTYGREKKAYDYMTAKGITAFYPTTDTVKLIKGKRKIVIESRLPNIFFAYGTEEQLKTFVYDNEISHLYSDLVRKPDTDGIMVHCGRCLIEVFTESSGSTYIYRNQFHEVEGKVRGFTTGQYGAQAYGVVGIGFYFHSTYLTAQ